MYVVKDQKQRWYDDDVVAGIAMVMTVVIAMATRAEANVRKDHKMHTTTDGHA